VDGNKDRTDSSGAHVRVISASRRTDIPAFYSHWLVNRLRAGYCHWVNPFNATQVYRVSLRPDDCLAIVFWTRNAAPLLPHLDRIAGHRFYFQYTINGYPREIESHAPPLDSAIAAFVELSRCLSPDLVHWRYDPILLDDLTLNPEYHLARFAAIARRLAGHTERCYFSFVDRYGKTSRNLTALEHRLGVHFREPGVDERIDLARRMVEVASPLGISLHSCCGDELVGAGVNKASCIDRQLIARLVGDDPRLKAAPTRKDCGCVEATDIGAYDTCTFGCAYCYATNSREAALRRMRAHDPNDSLLYRPPSFAGRKLEEIEVIPKEPTRRSRTATDSSMQLDLFSGSSGAASSIAKKGTREGGDEP
jgi:hypothetical protein